MSYPYSGPLPPAEISVSAAQFSAGAFPAVCFKTGVPTDNRAAVKFSTSPPWVGIATVLLLFLFLVGAVLGLITHFVVRKRVAGYLPMAPSVEARYRNYRRALAIVVTAPVVMIAVGVIVIVLSPASTQSTGPGALIVIFSLLALVAGLIAALPLLRVSRPRAIVFDDRVGQRWVMLKGVHPNFSAAVLHLQYQWASAAYAAQGYQPQPAASPAPSMPPL